MRTARKLALVQLQDELGQKYADAAGASALAITDLTRTPYEGNSVERTRLRYGFGANAQINTGPYTTVQITVPLAGSGTAGVAPAFGPLLRACGVSEVIDEDAGTVTYQPVSDDYDRVNFWYVYDGEVQQLVDALGTATITAGAAALPTLQITLTGLYNKPTAFQAGNHPLENQADEIPVNAQNTPTFTVHGYETVAQSFALDFGNTVAYQNLVNWEGVDITARASSGQIQVKAVGVGTHDYFEAMESHQVTRTGPVRVVHGIEAGNIVEFNGPNAQLSGLSDQDQDGTLHYTMTATYLPSGTDTDDDWTLTFR